MTFRASRRRISALILTMTTAAAGSAQAEVGDAELRAARADGEWLTHGGDYAETRYSTLAEIDRGNVARLGLAWSVEVGAPGGRVETTPLVVDGVLYGTTTWSVTFAIDLATQTLRWRYDPEVPRQGGPRVCCGPVNRGPAFYDGKVYVATLDGRLVALDAATGAPVWSVQTTPPGPTYSITGAPRVVQGKVVIGNGGGDYGARGYVTAYDAVDGGQVWRFYTVPGDPSQPFEHPALERAAATWTGEWWQRGGGGTAWDSFAYDPEANLLYVGVGNGGPWNRDARSPEGGDNLYLSSILALRPENGDLVWHFQTTPGDNWDFTAVQNIVLADLTIDGRERKVLMQAPKNGFFYVLDRLTGEFISGEPFTRVNWATGLDPKTGRPIERPEARYGTDPVEIYPSPRGGHNWHPMAWNPELGLMYVPGQEMPFTFRGALESELGIVFGFGGGGGGFGRGGGAFGGRGGGAPQQPLQLPTIGPEQPPGEPGFLVAWDPVSQKERWRVNFTSRENSGVLTTAGGLVFAGTATGLFGAYDAATGETLWSQQIYANIASPITYEHGGKQYVAVLASGPNNNPPARMLVFALDGDATAPGL